MARSAVPGGHDPAVAVDEATLVYAARQDPDAFGELYARYLDRVYAYVWARTGRAEDAADLTQQIFVQALGALPRYRVRLTPFAAWLFRIARNVVTDWQRRQRPTVPWDGLPAALQPGTTGTLDDGLLRAEERDRLRVLLADLDARTREAIILRFTAQLTLAEIGAVLGLREDAVRKRITRALHTLKEQYHDDAR